MSQVNPPYRADVVGSFLRPKELLDARHAFQAGKLDRASLTPTRILKKVVARRPFLLCLTLRPSCGSREDSRHYGA